jgi:hypothetical protein
MARFVITCPLTLYAMRLERFRPKWAAWITPGRCTPELEAEYQELRELQRELDPTGKAWERWLPDIEKPPGWGK